ncbi:50S ribosomal protein L4 [Cryptococcus amylolentus CBS 6039]|uniref:Large ribosomal subunit protein uL4m n=2 Tax=Cryptococcus amylolentus TaxID=104669 RepID=A0A1E3I9W6_9TREE|nr:50S ribosomal protein L4 [Cryptococcus amylolentus CBS 6039]ODN84636.1 50S ribosomal protein L4 [Cryptococcus amylolentus CBS 6039]ODO11604.1 50S ribosomal protein L4 [Cryptococcus amylolentus CBS 6273]
MKPAARLLLARPRTLLRPLPLARPASTDASTSTSTPPPNVAFEDLSQQASLEMEQALAEREVHLATWFPSNSGRHEPILLPVSSLASPTPTQPSGDDVVIALPPDIFAQPIRRDILHRCVVWHLSQLRQGNKQTKSRSTVNYSGRKLIPQKGTGRARAGDASSGTRRGGAPIHPIAPKNWAQSLPRKVNELGLKIALSSKLQSGLLRVVQDLGEGGWSGTREARKALANGVEWPRSESGLEQVPEATAAEELGLEEHVQEKAIEEQVKEDVKDAVETAVEPSGPIYTPRFGAPDDLSILFLYTPWKLESELESFFRATRNIPGVNVMAADEATVYDILKSRWLVLEGGAVDYFGDDAGPLSLEDFEQPGEYEVEEGVEAVDSAREEALKA